MTTNTEIERWFDMLKRLSDLNDSIQKLAEEIFGADTPEGELEYVNWRIAGLQQSGENNAELEQLYVRRFELGGNPAECYTWMVAEEDDDDPDLDFLDFDDDEEDEEDFELAERKSMYLDQNFAGVMPAAGTPEREHVDQLFKQWDFDKAEENYDHFNGADKGWDCPF